MDEDLTQFIERMDARDNEIMDKLFSEEGSGSHRIRGDARYQENFNSTLQLVADVSAGRKQAWKLQEAMAVSQFPSLFGGVLERKLVGAYTAHPSVWKLFAGQEMVSDFRKVKPVTLEGVDGSLPKVKPQTEYPLATFKEGNYEYFVEKFGRTVPFSFESSINDDLQIIRKTPDSLGRAAMRTEDRLATQQLVSETGPNPTLFKEANGGNLLTGALNQTNLEKAFLQMAYMGTSNGEPIVNTPAILLVPPALKITADKLINATQIAYTATNEKNQVWGTNVFGGLKAVENPYLTSLCTDASIRHTQWYLLADPNTVDTIPAVIVAKLRGHETPEVFMKTGDSVRVGGVSSPFDGSFNNDSITYKVRHIVGAAIGDYRMAIASTGQS